MCQAAAVTADRASDTDPRTKLQKVVVLGGTGRVGGSTAEALLDRCTPCKQLSWQHGVTADAKSLWCSCRLPGEELEVTVASRSESSYAEATKKRPSLKGARFVACNIDDGRSLEVRPLQRLLLPTNPCAWCMFGRVHMRSL